MLLSRTISCCKILQLKFFFSTLSNFKNKITITGTLTITGSSTLVGISKSAVYRILTKNLDMRKLCARWAPRFLTMGQKQRREDVSIECSAMFHSNETDFLR